MSQWIAVVMNCFVVRRNDVFTRTGLDNPLPGPYTVSIMKRQSLKQSHYFAAYYYFGFWTTDAAGGV